MTDHRNPIWNYFEGSILTWILLVVAIAVLIWLVVRIRAWFRDDSGPAATEYEMLMQFKELRREGNLSEEEYRSIKNELTSRINDSARSDGN